MADKNRFTSEETVSDISTSNTNISALVSKLSGYHFDETTNTASLNIDTINGVNGYIFRMVVGSNSTGTQPTSIIGGNGYILIGFSYMNSNLKPIYGVQIAFGFGSSKIAIRSANYNASGGSWSAWTQV